MLINLSSFVATRFGTPCHLTLYKHLWNIALTDIEQSEDEWSFQSSNDGGRWLSQNKEGHFERHFVRQFEVRAGV